MRIDRKVIALVKKYKLKDFISKNFDKPNLTQFNSISLIQ